MKHVSLGGLILSRCGLGLLFNPFCLRVFFLGSSRLTVFADVVAGGGVTVLRAWRASGAGLAGFRRAGRAGQCLADVPEPAAHPGGSQPAGRAGPLPGQPDVIGEVASELELGVAGDDQPGPPVRGGRVPQLGPGPAEHLLEESERVFEIEAAQERLPGTVGLLSGGARG